MLNEAEGPKLLKLASTIIE